MSNELPLARIVLLAGSPRYAHVEINFRIDHP
jgi:hypothetical protein